MTFWSNIKSGTAHIRRSGMVMDFTLAIVMISNQAQIRIGKLRDPIAEKRRLEIEEGLEVLDVIGIEAKDEIDEISYETIRVMNKHENLSKILRELLNRVAILGAYNQEKFLNWDNNPPCDVCGTITVRMGTCFKCLNCGNPMGCT